MWCDIVFESRCTWQIFCMYWPLLCVGPTRQCFPQYISSPRQWWWDGLLDFHTTPGTRSNTTWPQNFLRRGRKASGEAGRGYRGSNVSVKTRKKGQKEQAANDTPWLKLLHQYRLRLNVEFIQNRGCFVFFLSLIFMVLVLLPSCPFSSRVWQHLLCDSIYCITVCCGKRWVCPHHCWDQHFDVFTVVTNQLISVGLLFIITTITLYCISLDKIMCGFPSYSLIWKSLFKTY